jgi:hypothetical protein
MILMPPVTRAKRAPNHHAQSNYLMDQQLLQKPWQEELSS